MQVSDIKNKCFTILSNELEGRFDPHFYKPDFSLLEKKLKKISYSTLGDVVEFSNEIWNGKDFFADKFPYIEISEIDIRTGEIKDITYYEKSEAPSRAKMIVRNNDIIVSTTRPHRGAVAFIDSSKDGFIASTGFSVLRDLKNKEVNKSYLFYILRTSFILDQMLRRSSGGNYPAITAEELKKIIIPVPSLEIQLKIVEIMQSAYDKKASKEQKAESVFNSIDDYILGELGIKMPEAEDKECFSISSQEIDSGRLDCYYYQPKFKEGEKFLKKADCKVEPLKNYITKIHYGASLKNIYVDEGIPLLRIQNLKPNRIMLDEVVMVSEARRKELGNAFVNEGDLLISRSGSVGIVSVVPKEAEGFAFGSFMIKFCLNDKIDKDFVSVWLNNKISQLFIKREKIGAIQGNITIETIENLQIPTPPLATQKKLAGEVKERIAQAKKISAEAKNEVEKAKILVENLILNSSK